MMLAIKLKDKRRVTTSTSGSTFKFMGNNIFLRQQKITTAGWLSIYFSLPTISSGREGPIKKVSSESSLYKRRLKNINTAVSICHFQFRINFITGESKGQTDIQYKNIINGNVARVCLTLNPTTIRNSMTKGNIRFFSSEWRLWSSRQVWNNKNPSR